MFYVHFSDVTEWLEDLEQQLELATGSVLDVRLTIRSRPDRNAIPITGKSVVASFLVEVPGQTPFACCLEHFCGESLSPRGETDQKVADLLEKVMALIRQKVADLGFSPPRGGAVIEPSWRS